MKYYNQDKKIIIIIKKKKLMIAKWGVNTFESQIFYALGLILWWVNLVGPRGYRAENTLEKMKYAKNDSWRHWIPRSHLIQPSPSSQVRVALDFGNFFLIYCFLIYDILVTNPCDTRKNYLQWNLKKLLV